MHVRQALRRLAVLCCALALALACTLTGSAQTKLDVRLNIIEAQPSAEEVVNHVHAQVSVVDGSGMPVQGLGIEAFRVFEDSAPVSLTYAAPAQGAMAVVLVIDTSGSMNYADKGGRVPIQEIKKAVRSLIEHLREEDEVALITFSTEVNLVTDFTRDHNAVIGAMDQVVAEGWTCLYDAIYRALDKAAQKPLGRRAVVVFSDGFDEGPENKPCSVHTQPEIISKASDPGLQVPIYAVGLESRNVARDDLVKLAADTGGRSAITPSAAALTDLFSTLAAQLTSVYELVYRSVAPAGIHQLAVQVNVGNASGDSQVKSFGVLPVNPRPRIINPRDGDTLDEATTISVEVLSQCALAEVRVSIDDTLLQELRGDRRSLSIAFDPKQYPEGAHQLRVVALDCNNLAGEVVINVGIGIAITPVPTQAGASPVGTAVIATATPAPTREPTPTATACPFYSLDECNENRDYVIYGGIGLLALIIALVVTMLLRKRRAAAVQQPAALPWGAGVSLPPQEPAWTPPSVESRPPSAWAAETPTELAGAAEDVTREATPAGAVLAKLTVRKSLQLPPETVFELQARDYRIGRSQSPEFSNDLVIPDSPVSRQHATLAYQNGAFLLRDSGSKFGTRVNGQAVGPQGQVLRDGDEIMLGTQTVLLYQRTPPPPPPPGEELTEDVGGDLDATADVDEVDGTQEAGRSPDSTA